MATPAPGDLNTDRSIHAPLIVPANWLSGSGARLDCPPLRRAARRGSRPSIHQGRARGAIQGLSRRADHGLRNVGLPVPILPAARAGDLSGAGAKLYTDR